MSVFDFLKDKLDQDGQPLVKAFRSNAVIDRQIDELIGLIKGVMADGMVHQGEVEFLMRWIEVNRDVKDKWPAKAIYPRLMAALEDGNLTLEEEGEIMDILMAAVGGNTAPLIGESSNSTSLPYTAPVPEIVVEGRVFCFTGKFHSGSRNWCQSAVTVRGGQIADGITKKLHYLVIGEIGSRDWLHSTHGRKIEKAIQYNDAGGAIAIVPERHWFESLEVSGG